MDLEDSINANLDNDRGHSRFNNLQVFEDAMGCYILSKKEHKIINGHGTEFYLNKSIELLRNVWEHDTEWVKKYHSLIVKKDLTFETPLSQLSFGFEDDKLVDILENFYQAWHVKGWSYIKEGLSPAYQDFVQGYLQRHKEEYRSENKGMQPGFSNK